MSFARFIAISRVWEILTFCAPGYTQRRSRDKYVVQFQGHTYMLGCGSHGKAETKDIRASDVRKMSRTLGVEECVVGKMEPSST